MPARAPLLSDPAAEPPDALTVHGGRLAAARAAFPDALEPWIDLSTGINPHAYLVGDLPGAVWRRLPDPAALADLEAAACRCFGAPVDAGILAAPGTQALIQALPRVRPARHVAILGFGYQEHPDVWRAAGSAVSVVESVDALADADVAVVINPNNPDGRHVAPVLLASLAARMADRGGLLVVDEAFAEAEAPERSLVPHLAGRGALVLRSFGKFFGLAGLRLGFALGDAALCAALRRHLGAWAVSGPAIAVGSQALADGDWQAAARLRIAAEAARLDAVLIRAGFALRGGTALFRLAQHPDAAQLFDRLARAGILVRPFRQEPTWLRFGLPADAAAWERLAAALPP